MASPVYIVHCIDSEGPLHESVNATFERLKHIFHIDLPPSRDLLLKLQAGEFPLDGMEKAVQEVVDPHLLKYNDTWDKIDCMLEELLSESFRNTVKDSAGNGWIYNWFCVDHVDYEMNPRRRDMGYHNIFDHYWNIISESHSNQDCIQLHYHPHAFTKYANRCATHWWANSNTLYQVLARRIIDRNWFPAVNRPGFQVNRPDSHWFLEQFIPFDMASLAMDLTEDEQKQFDFSLGRSGDWRRAPRTWAPYHPSYDDYQVPGTCRRWIARCLNIGTRTMNVGENEIRQAFQEASTDKPVVLSFANHDFRDIRHDVNNVRQMLKTISSEFPDVKFYYCDVISAMRNALSLQKMPKCTLTLSLDAITPYAHKLSIHSDQPTFGPQPFLALKTTTGEYYHDNLDFQEPHHSWTYVLDEETFPIRAIESIGVAVNNAYGITSVAVMDVENSCVKYTYLNE